MRIADGGPNGRLRLVLGGAAAVVVVVAVLAVVLGGGGHTSDRGGSRPSPGNALTAPSVTSTAGRATSTAGRGTSTLGRGTSTAAAAPSGPAPLGPPAQPAPASEQFGISVNRLFNDQFAGRGYTRVQIDDQLTELAATGATAARSDTLWSAAEPNPPDAGGHRYDWAFDDEIAGTLAAHGLRWLPIVDYAPGWAATVPSSSVSPPRLVGDYAAFAGAFAARYGLGGSFWHAHPGLRAEPVDTYEIWNEPDNAQFWPPAPSATTYADMYLRARDAITGADPSARVIIGGLTNPGVFLPALAAARPGFFAHVDGVAIHPYGPTPAVVYWARARGTQRAHRARAGLDAPVRDRVRLDDAAAPLARLGPRARPSVVHLTDPQRARPHRLRAGRGDPLHLGDAGAEPRRPRGLVRHIPAWSRWSERVGHRLRRGVESRAGGGAGGSSVLGRLSGVARRGGVARSARRGPRVGAAGRPGRRGGVGESGTSLNVTPCHRPPTPVTLRLRTSLNVTRNVG